MNIDIDILKKMPRNIIFQSPLFETVRQQGFEIAAAWLNTSVEDLPFHPDFKYLGGEGDTLGVEKAGLVQEMAGYVPQGNCSVCVIAHAEAMTPDTQNRLLKILEDRAESLAVIFITCKPLLDTIHSRCLHIILPSCSLDEIYKRAGHPVPEYVYASDGNWEIYDKIQRDSKFNQYLEGFYSSYSNTKKRSDLRYVLMYTHALREKDPEYLPGMLEGWQMTAFLSMLEHMSWYLFLSLCDVKIPKWVKLGNLENLYTAEEAERIYRSVTEGKHLSEKKGRFTKNDFFNILMELIPLE